MLDFSRQLLIMCSYLGILKQKRFQLILIDIIYEL